MDGKMAGGSRISIGLPVYNGQAHLEQTLECLLSQDLQDFELIITDNASTDATPEICGRFARRDKRIRYYRSSCNRGAAANYNHAFHLARAPLFKWAPHDDLYAPSYLRTCVETLEHAGPEVVLCYPKALLIDKDGIVWGEHDDGLDIRDTTAPRRLYRLLQHRTSWCHPVLGVIRTQALARTGLIGGYAGSDHVVLAELVLLGQFHELPDRLFLRRIEGGLSPSLNANATPEERDAWFDTRNRDRVAVPRTRLLLEHIRAIHRAPLSRRERRACYRLLRTAPFSEHWGRTLLLDEWRRALRKTSWERYVLGGVRRARRHYLPHRLWAMLSGLKHGDLDRMLLAICPPSRHTHAALLEFVADCLSRRSDGQSRRILDEWLASDRQDYRLAAAKTAGRSCAAHAARQA
jgi:glycosyltransferase involved in cell wall biosynthesis